MRHRCGDVALGLILSPVRWEEASPDAGPSAEGVDPEPNAQGNHGKTYDDDQLGCPAPAVRANAEHLLDPVHLTHHLPTELQPAAMHTPYHGGLYIRLSSIGLC